ncbi:hypothetical protein VHN57_02175 [Sphingobium sp. WW5]|uniref:hypothetical protein n=1 Tax=unclassified Sphingobium TaxID=2611147 RepID=UPI003C24B4E1
MEKTSVGMGLGCLSIVPATFIGLAALTDGLGQTGWRGCAEIIGWIAVCIAVNFGLVLLFTPAG